MSASGLTAFRLFSGPHMGAELVLPAGSHLVGADDSCDIILQDSSIASRHADIVISLSGEGPPSVRVTPLDGEVLLDGAPLPPDGADIPERTPFFLGLTCMAWARPDESADAWRQVASSLQERRSAQERPEPAARQPEEPVMDLGDPMIVLDEGTAVGANDVGKTFWQRLRSLPPQRLGLSFLILLGLCGLTFSYAGRPPDAKTRVEEIQSIIKEHGFSTLVVSPQGDGVGVQGVLLDDAERADLLRLAQGVQYPVYLDVTLRGDRVDAVASAFASRGFSLSVQEKTGNPDDGLNLAGYMKDGLVEEQAFSAVREDVPELQDDAVWSRLDRSIRHADAVEAVVLPLLKTDLLTVMQAVESETLGSLTVEWRHASAACVILASGGYPGHYEKGKPISLPASAPGNVTIYHAGDRLDENGQLVTSGGRVLGVTATGPTLRQALHDAYAAARAVDFDGKYLRHDIGQRALAALAD